MAVAGFVGEEGFPEDYGLTGVDGVDGLLFIGYSTGKESVDLGDSGVEAAG